MKAQADAAEEIKRERREQEKREQRARAEEAVRARLSGGRHKHIRSSRSHPHLSSRCSWREEREGSHEKGWDRWDGRAANREKERRVRKWETWDGREEKHSESEQGKKKRRKREEGREKKRERNTSRGKDERDSRNQRKTNDTNDTNDNRGRMRRYRSRSASPRRKRNTEEGRRQRKRSTSRRRFPSPGRSSGRHALDNLYSSEDSNGDFRRYHDVPSSRHDDLVPSTSSSNIPPIESPNIRQNRSGLSASPPDFSPAPKSKSEPCSRSSSRTQSMSLSSRPSSLSPGPSPSTNLPSKMDKYFQDSYDPRLDTAPLSTVPNIPTTGLINDVEFEGWDAMLELIKLRRQDKEERKRLERLGLKDKKGKGKDKEKVDINMSAVSGSASLLDIEYKKRGAVREWDLGKEDLSF